MEIRSIRTLIVLLLSMILIFSCAGSADEGESFSDDSQNQKELDDIEALLGIQSDKSEPKKDTKKPTKKNESTEKLDLLGTSDMINTSQPANVTPEEKKKLEDQIKKLEKQVQQKDDAISDLNSKISIQATELQKRPSSSGSSNTIVSDISIEEYQMRYDDARSEFEARNYNAAIPLFESLLGASAQHSLSDNAQYWIGECHFALGQYNSAIIDFEKVFTFPKSNKLDDAQYKLGLCYLKKGDKTKAREEFDRFLRDYPNSELTSKAEKHLSKI